jgi:hypothetical protein
MTKYTHHHHHYYYYYYYYNKNKLSTLHTNPSEGDSILAYSIVQSR